MASFHPCSAKSFQLTAELVAPEKTHPLAAADEVAVEKFRFAAGPSDQVVPI